jgi:cytochrome c2
MPNFWPEALSIEHAVRKGSPEAGQRDNEVRKIVAYLWKNSEESNLPAIPVKGDPQRGKELVQQVGCRACHTFVPQEKLCKPEDVATGKSRGTPQEPGECEVARSITGSDARDFAPNLSNIGYKAKDRWLFAWLKNPTAMWRQTRMPNLRLSDQEAADLTAHLMTLKNGPAPARQPFFDKEDSKELLAAAQDGEKLIAKYGCTGCHDVKGHENDAKVGADLNEFGRKAVDLLDFGNAIPNPRHHSWYNWIDLKLRAPRAYRYERVDTRMPQFDFDDREVDAIMTFLKSRFAEKIPYAFLAGRDDRRIAVARGDQLTDYFNCRGCHVIDFQGGSIRDVYAEDDLWKAPPILQQEGWRVQPDWLFGFIEDPSTKLRPWLNVRMPTFPMSDERATTVVRYFSAKANVPYPYVSARIPPMSPKDAAEAKAMVYDQLKCFKCHTAGAPGAEQDPASLAPNLELAKHRLRPDWVEAWIKNPQSLQEGTRMPNFFTPENFETVMYPKYFGGSQEKQIKALRDFVMTLPDTPASKPQAAEKKEMKKKRADLRPRPSPAG